jgi:hypothetical protein
METRHAAAPARIRLSKGQWVGVTAAGLLLWLLAAAGLGTWAQVSRQQSCEHLGGFLTESQQCVKVQP